MQKVKYKEFGDIKVETVGKFYNATTVLTFFNETRDSKKRMYDFLRRPATIEYIGYVDSITKTDVLFNTFGSGASTFMHEILFAYFIGWFSDPEFNSWAMSWMSIGLIKTESHEHRIMKAAYLDYPYMNPSMFYTDTIFIRNTCMHDGVLNDVDYIGLVSDSYILNSILLKAKLGVDDRLMAIKNYIVSFWAIKDENKRIRAMANLSSSR